MQDMHAKLVSGIFPPGKTRALGPSVGCGLLLARQRFMGC
jgi:hypothetical protein